MKPERKRIITRGVEEEPSVGTGEIPVIFFAALAGLVFIGLLFLDRFGGGFHNQVYRPYESMDRLLAVQPKDEAAKAIAQGMQTYETCKLCHQANGLGTPGQFPPLDGSEWVTGSVDRLIRIPLHGVQGPMTIKGEPWNAAMPAMGAALSDEELANLLTYIRQAWSNKAGKVTVDQVKKVRAAEASRTQPWTETELLALPPE